MSGRKTTVVATSLAVVVAAVAGFVAWVRSWDFGKAFKDLTR